MPRREPKPKGRKWKSVKVPEDTYKKLKGMGKGIGKAMDILVKAKGKGIKKTIEQVEGVANELAETLLEAGIFDIKLKGANITNIIERSDTIRIEGYVDVQITDEEAREKIVELLSPSGEKEEEQQEEEEKEEDAEE